MKASCLFLLITLFLASNSAFSKEAPFQLKDSAFLIQSCGEAIEIFASQEKTGYLAAYRTSLSEAMRAGYCIGVIEHFTEVYVEYCGRSSGWFEHAKSIASLELTQQELAQTDAHRLLEEYVCVQ
jgi:hypothetical protein